MKKFLKLLLYLCLILIVGVIFFSSIVTIYDFKKRIVNKIHLGHAAYFGPDSNEIKFLREQLYESKRQIPPNDIKDLIINSDADILGQWGAPIDWNVTAIHSVLLPDETVMTFGTFGIDEKDTSKNIISNKKIVLSDGRKIERDIGSLQWKGHDVNSGIDFDIWNYKKGVLESSHTLYKKPVVMDAFCSIVRVIDENRVFILGGNKNIHTNLPDTQNNTMLYNVKDKKFILSKKLNMKRWYGSAVITGDEKMIILGGKDIVNQTVIATTPEIIDLKNLEKGWSLLEAAKSKELFGEDIFEEWSYPKAFLASDGNIVGVSYNKLWMMDKDNDYRIFKTGEIPLIKSGIFEDIKPTKKFYDKQNQSRQNLKLLTIGSAVGHTSSAVMTKKDTVLVFGGQQVGGQYSPSNKVFSIDFSNTSKPILQELKSMNHARSNGNATILPDGNIFLNGGHSYSDEYSNFIPEIYNPDTQISTNLSESQFHRNYHSSSLLLPDGRVLTAGGDMWNAEIYYPPYFFTKDINNKTILASRPKILNIENKIKRGEKIKVQISGDVSNVNLISTGSVTHAQGSEPKFRKIPFIKLSDNEISLKLDNNPNNIQNGMYLIFVLDSKGVPSEGKIVYIN